jgi:GNAT superfamily N-acetyltransferase
METLRVAELADIPALQALITRSGLGLSAPFYTPEQAAAVTHHVFGVDSQLIEDRTYLVIENGGLPLACGGWSRRRTLYGGDQTKHGSDPMLDPLLEPARIRAFFVEPGCERRGLATRLLTACVQAARDAGFRAMELAATLPGEPLYQARGFHVTKRMALDLPGGVQVPLALMRREL